MNHNDPYIYFFPHIPKCAGMSVRVHIEHCIPPENRFFAEYNFDSLNKQDQLHHQFASMTKDQRRKIRYVYGHHVFYGIHEMFDRPHRYITITRSPVRRLISGYQFRKKQWLLLSESERLIHPVYKEYPNPKIFPSFEEWLTLCYDSPHGSYLDIISGVENTQFRYLQKLGYISKTCPSDNEGQIVKELRKFSYIADMDYYPVDEWSLYRMMNIDSYCSLQNQSPPYITTNDLERCQKLLNQMAEKDRPFIQAVKQQRKQIRQSDFYWSLKDYLYQARRLVRSHKTQFWNNCWRTFYDCSSQLKQSSPGYHRFLHRMKDKYPSLKRNMIREYY